MRYFANLLTLARLALAPFAVHAVWTGNVRLALALFAVAAVTDALDGPLARRTGSVSRFGAYADPIADKLLLSATYLALGASGRIPVWIVALVFGRDVFILALVALALLLTAYRSFPPSIWGKLSTFCQAGAALFVLIAQEFQALAGVSRLMLWIAAAVTIWSGLDYARRAFKMARVAAGKRKDMRIDAGRTEA
jgi:cardiolipin synthase (CMP-forming)